jgi:hypothetical protein
VEPLGHGAVRLLHLGDLREQVAFPFGPLLVLARFGLQLSGALLIAARSSAVNPSDFFASSFPPVRFLPRPIPSGKKESTRGRVLSLLDS